MTPGKGGHDVEGIPVFDTVSDAVAATGADASFVSVPRPAAAAAILEAAEAGSRFIVVHHRGHPGARRGPGLQHACSATSRARACSARTAPASSAPASATSASPPARSRAAGRARSASCSRSGTLTYQALYELKQQGIGVTTCVGIGGDPVPGTELHRLPRAFEADPETQAVIMFGEIGGSAEEEAAEFIAAQMAKPVVAYVAGVTAPAGKKMGHAGAIVSGGKGTAQGEDGRARGGGRARSRRTRPRPAS